MPQKTPPTDPDTVAVERATVVTGVRNLPRGIPPQAVTLEYVRSRGAGGQHVNKVSTAVQLRCALYQTQLPQAVIQRVLALAGNRATKNGEVLLRADRYRSQLRNREDALQRLADLVRQAQQVPKRRRATRVSAAQKGKRRDAKTRRGATKKLRGRPSTD